MKGRISRLLYASIVICWPLEEVSAGPDKVADRFMSDTPSMMDWGTVRLENYLRSLDHSRDVTVAYDWDKNRLIIGKILLLNEPVTLQHEEACREWMGSVRAASLISIRTGEPIPPLKRSTFSNYFSHIGYTRTIEGTSEEQALDSLDKMISLRWVFYRESEEEYKADLVCTGDLRGTTVALER